jgi:hypothetical protein
MGRYSLDDRRERETARTSARRASWLAAIAEAPDASRTELVRKHNGTWLYLCKHDMAWLLTTMPARTPGAWKAKRSCVDWAARDVDFRHRCERAVTRIEAAAPPQRLTLAAIGHEAGIRAMLVGEKNRLPLTRSYIASVAETVATFTRRRIRWNADRLIEAGIIPTYSDFLEACGIEWPKRMRYDEELRSELTRVRIALQPDGSDAFA